MKKCNECNYEMVENCKIEGQHPFEVGMDGSSNISIHVPTGEKRTSFLGTQYDVTKNFRLKARICPKCGKIELYAEVK